MTKLEDDIAARVADVRARLSAAGGADRVRLVAMTKGFDASAARAAVAAGVVDLGESRAQELLSKAPELADLDVRWHFAGPLQTNKVRLVGGLVSLWHSVDRPAAGDELIKRVPGAAVLVQVDVAGNRGQHGCPPEDATDLVHRLTDGGLDVRGLMAIGPPGPAEAARPAFRRLVELADELGLPERSIGMSGDLEVAVEEGSTMVRIGRALFGDRPRAGGARSLTSPP